MASTRAPNQSVRLTKTVIDRVALPAIGQAFLRDSHLKGFALRVTAGGAKSFVVEKRIGGRVVRKTLAAYGELTVEQARREALKFLGQVAQGINPIAQRERDRLRSKVLEEVFEDFLRVRKSLKARTVYDYRRLLKVAFEPWQRRPIVTITKDLIVKRHQELGENSGEAYANLAMRFLRSLMGFAMAHYEDGFGRPLLTENPVLRLTQTRAWYRAERRQTVIKVHQLPAWYRAVETLRQAPEAFSDTVGDYLLVLLLTGLRRQEAAQLTWDRIDLKDCSLTIPDPKNRQAFLLPYSDFVAGILERRHRVAESAFVFPGQGRLGHLIEPKKQLAKVVEASGVEFTIHDLRRTFITAAESIDIPPYAIKRMVNHKLRGDVTAGYIVTDVARLRDPVQRVTDFLLKVCRQKATAQVVELRAAPAAA